MYSEKIRSDNESLGFNVVATNKPVTLRRKLSVGAVNDPLEHEADAMADKVMRMPEINFIQKKCAHCEEEEAQRKPLMPFIQEKEIYGKSLTSDSVHR